MINKTAGTSEEPPIYNFRGGRVVLDADLARIYGVTTSRFNEAFKGNLQRFPEDFVFQLNEDEFMNLRSQFAIGSQKHRDPKYLPWAFTEHGAIMAANILRSDCAVQVSVYVVRAFVRMREQIAANQTILRRLAEIDKASTILPSNGITENRM